MHIYAQGWGQGSRATIGPTPGSMGMKRRRPMTQRWSICSVFSLTAMSCCNCVRIFTMRDIVSSDWWSVSFSWRIVLYNSCTSHSSLQTAHDTIRYDTIRSGIFTCAQKLTGPVASPGFGARRGTCKSYWVFTEGNCRHMVAVKLCTGQSALKKLNCSKSRGGTCPSAQ